VNDFTYAEIEQALKSIPSSMVPALLRILLERADKEVFLSGGLDRFIQRVREGRPA
jgi:hypothetical protein